MITLRKLPFSVLLYLILLHHSGTASAQQIHYNEFLKYVDEPVEYNKALLSAGYHEIDIYSCRDSIFSKAFCPCTSKKIFNDTGRIIQVILGNDVDKGLINYIVNYESLNDSQAIVEVEYQSRYADSVQDQFFIYGREKDGSLVVHSFLKFTNPNDRDLPDTVFRYDRNHKLKEIYYPLGNRKPVKGWTDSVKSPDRLKISLHLIFKENEYHSYTIYNTQGLILETGSSNIKTEERENPNEEQSLYVYNDSSRLIFIQTVGGNNVFRSEEAYFYKNNTLIKYSKKYNLTDSLHNILKLYNDQGQMTYYQERAEGYPYDLWQYFYTFKNGLLEKTIYLKNTACEGASYFLYK